MGENVSFFKQKTKVEKASPPLSILADGISKVGSLEGLRYALLVYFPALRRVNGHIQMLEISV